MSAQPARRLFRPRTLDVWRVLVPLLAPLWVPLLGMVALVEPASAAPASPEPDPCEFDEPPEPQVPPEVRPWSLGIALGGGLVRQSGGAPPLCCGERDTWNGGQVQAEVRLALNLGPWFSVTADLGGGTLWTDEASQPEDYSHSWVSAHLVPELRVPGEDWRGRLGLGAGIGPKDFDALARLGVDHRVGPAWLGLEYRAVQSGLALSTHSILFVMWY